MDAKELRKRLLELLGIDDKNAPEGTGVEGFTDEQLAEAAAKAVEANVEAREARDVELSTAIVETYEAIRAEITSREEHAAEVDAALEALAGRIATDEVEEPDAEVEEEEVETPEPTAEVEVEEPEVEEPEVPAAPVAEETPETPETPAEPATPAAPVKQPIAASSASLRRPIVPRPKGKPKKDTPRVQILASGDVSGFSAGSRMNIAEMADAFVEKAQALSGSQAKGRYPVAKIRDEFPSDRILRASASAEENQAMIDDLVLQNRRETYQTLRRMATSRDPEEVLALTAAGGICAPLTPKYDLFDLGDTVRPLLASLTQFGAERGGIRYVDPDSQVTMADTLGAIARFTKDDDLSGARYPKPCIRVDCPTWTEAFVEAISVCFEVGIWLNMTYPELFRQWWQRTQVALARVLEEDLWNNMIGLCSQTVTAGEGLGVARDLPAQVARAATQIRWRWRIAPEVPLRLWMPDWIEELMRIDLDRQAPGDDKLATPDAELFRFFAVRNIAVTEVLDAQSPGGTSGDIQVDGALNPWPTSATFILAPEGTFTNISLPELNFGTEIRDFTLIRNNDVGAFYETFENVIRTGPIAYALTMPVCPNGQTAGPDTSFDPCVLGS